MSVFEELIVFIIEEQIRMDHQYSPSFGNDPIDDEIQQKNIETGVGNPRRQVSLIYGVQFNSQVPLYQRNQSTIESRGLNLFSQQEIHHKVHSFLKGVIENTPEIVSLLQGFKQLQGEMALSVCRSKNTISQCSNGGSQDSIENSDKEISCMQDYSNRVIVKQEKCIKQKNNKNRGSMMKSNRISIADAIKISEMPQLKQIIPLQSIDSSSSFSSAQSPHRHQNARCFEILSLSSTGDSHQFKPEEINRLKERVKKVSIMSAELDFSQFQSEIFSQDGEPLSLKNIKTPQFPFQMNIIQAVFDSPCPFLVNLSLCLLCKCIAKSGVGLSESDVAWILATATIVAYKIYYDETITGLMQFYSTLLGIRCEEMAQLQRWFLQKVGYQVVVSNSQYQSVLLHLVSR